MKTPNDSLALKWQSDTYPKRFLGNVPKRVKVIKNTGSDFDEILKANGKSPVRVYKGQMFDVIVNSLGAVTALIGDDELGLKPDEFEVIEWHYETTKAWRVCPRGYRWGDDDLQDVLHAPNRSEAIMKSWLYRDGDFEFIELKALREPKMDGLELTDRNFVAHGYFVHCANDFCDHVAEGPDGGDPLFDEQGRAWCWECAPEGLSE